MPISDFFVLGAVIFSSCVDYTSCANSLFFKGFLCRSLFFLAVLDIVLARGMMHVERLKSRLRRLLSLLDLSNPRLGIPLVWGAPVLRCCGHLLIYE